MNSQKQSEAFTPAVCEIVLRYTMNAAPENGTLCGMRT